MGAAEDEVMGGDDQLGLRDCPRLPDSLLVGPTSKWFHLRFVVKETFNEKYCLIAKNGSSVKHGVPFYF